MTPKRDALIACAKSVKAEELRANRTKVAAWIISMPEKEWIELWPAFQKLMRSR